MLQLLPSLVEEAFLSDHIAPNLVPPLVIVTTDSWPYTYHPLFSKGSDEIYDIDARGYMSKVDGEIYYPAPIFLFGPKRLEEWRPDLYPSDDDDDLDFTLIGYSLRKLKYFLQTGSFDGISEKEKRDYGKRDYGKRVYEKEKRDQR